MNNNRKYQLEKNARQEEVNNFVGMFETSKTDMMPEIDRNAVVVELAKDMFQIVDGRGVADKGGQIIIKKTRQELGNEVVWNEDNPRFGTMVYDFK